MLLEPLSSKVVLTSKGKFFTANLRVVELHRVRHRVLSAFILFSTLLPWVPEVFPRAGRVYCAPAIHNRYRRGCIPASTVLRKSVKFFRMSREPRKWTLRVQNIIWGSIPRTPLEAFAFGTCFENRSPFILDPRLRYKADTVNRTRKTSDTPLGTTPYHPL